MSKIHLIIFASEGLPNDEGTPLAQKLFPSIFKLNEEKGFCDVIHAYTPKIFKEQFPKDEFAIKNYDIDEDDATALIGNSKVGGNPGYAKIGCGLWRFILIKHVMEIIDDDSIIILHDPNFIKTPEILTIVFPNLRDYVAKALMLSERGKIFAPMHDRMGRFVNRNKFNVFFDNNLEEVMKFYDCPIGRLRVLITRKNIDFFDNLINICKNNIGQLIQRIGGITDDFHHDTYEQAMFNCYAYKCGIFDAKKDLFITDSLYTNYGYQNDSGYARMRHLTKKYAIIVQGPDYGQRTIDIVNYYLNNNADNTIVILSTWKQSDKEQENKWNTIKEKWIERFYPILTDEPLNGKMWKNNFSHRMSQRYSTHLGINFTKQFPGIKWILKTRTDHLVRKENICHYLEQNTLKYPVNVYYNHKYRLTVNSFGNSTIKCWGKFKTSDFFLFGDIDTMSTYYSMDDITPESNFFVGNLPKYNNNMNPNYFSPETDFIEYWLYKTGIIIDNIEMLFRNLFIIVDDSEIKLILHKDHPLNSSDSIREEFVKKANHEGVWNIDYKYWKERIMHCTNFNITFKPLGRTGNLIFEYLACKLVELSSSGMYKYVRNDTILDNPITIVEKEFNNFLISDNKPKRDIVLEGYFQQGEPLVKNREALINIIKCSNDSWIVDNKISYINDFLNSVNPYKFNDDDIVISLRLDDFIQTPCKTSDILPEKFYLDIIEEHVGKFDKLYIICDRISHEWERQYLRAFDKWKPIRQLRTLVEDCAAFRDSPFLIHSNSTICWIMSFLSPITTRRKRIIPLTHFYVGQLLCKIEETDIIIDVVPLSHPQVFGMSHYNSMKEFILPLPYSIPSEYIVSPDSTIDNKIESKSLIIPGVKYSFTYSQEKEYLEQYKNACYAITKKKGGWDCLRHYEILAAGCIPIFEELEKCPELTMVSFPKHLLLQDIDYKELRKKLLQWMIENCSTEITFKKYIVNKLNPKYKDFKRVLLIRCNEGVNYTRELFWIGIMRYLSEGIIGEYPRIPYIYTDWPLEKNKDLYGLGFGYTRKINRNTSKLTFIDDEDEVVKKTQEGFWDLIVYGKVGLNEGKEMPLWNEVVKIYNRHQIIFLYGGDCPSINLQKFDDLSMHVIHNAEFGTCFVREFKLK